jgi:hypothetical protein
MNVKTFFRGLLKLLAAVLEDKDLHKVGPKISVNPYWNPDIGFKKPGEGTSMGFWTRWF